MKSKLFFTIIICLFGITSIFTQPSFTSSDLPGIGDHDTVRYLQYYPITNNLDAETGNGYNWDFSVLPFSTYPNFYTVDSFRVKTHNISQTFTNASIEEYIYDGTAGDVNLFSFSNDTLFIHRQGSVLNGSAYIPPLASISFPILFNNSSVINSFFYVNTTIVGARKTTTLYDGYGTLKMPNGKNYDNVMRIKKTERDTSYVGHTVNTYTNYIWYKKGGQIPLLRLTYTGSTNLYLVFGSKSNNISTEINEISDINKINFYPNPSNGKFILETAKMQYGTLEIYNVMGERCFESEITNLKSEIDLSNQPKGIYFVKIYSEKTTYTKKIIVQ